MFQKVFFLLGTRTEPNVWKSNPKRKQMQLHVARKRSYVGFQSCRCEYEMMTSRKSLSRPARELGVLREPNTGNGFTEYCILGVFYNVFSQGNGDLTAENGFAE